MRVLAVLVVVIGCGGTKDAPVDKSAAVASKPAPADAATPAPVAPLVMLTDDGGFPFTLGIAFEGKYPQLPAVNPDGTLLANFESKTFGPMPIPPMSVVFESFGGHAPDKIDIIDEPSADAASQIEDWAKTPGAAPVIKTMREHAKQALALLNKYQFGSLVPVEFPIESSGAKKPAKIGDMILASEDSTTESEAMSVFLEDAKGTVLVNDVIAPYTQGTYNIGEPETHTCWYRPLLGTAFTDASKQHLYLDIGFRWHEECGPPVSTRWIVWDLAVARAAPAALAAVKAVVAAELVAKTRSGIVASPHGLGTPAITSDPRVTLARDGNSAWASVGGKDWRASFVVVKATGWRVDSAMWSQGVADSVVNAKGKAKALPALDALTGDPGDNGLRAAFVAMTKQGLDDVAAVRPELVGIGSAPGEQTATGDVLARGWDASWKGHVTISSIVAHLAPSKTTGSVVATVSLAKPGGYSIPFMLFCVFDEQSDGSWSLVHIHFAV